MKIVVYQKPTCSTCRQSDDQIVDLMVAHPDLMQRPIVEQGNRAILARPADRLTAFLKT